MTSEQAKSVITQLGLAVFGVLALVLAYSKNEELLRLSPIVGLMGQPFWLYFSYKSKAWGMAFLSLVYTGVYVYGALKIFWPERLAAW